MSKVKMVFVKLLVKDGVEFVNKVSEIKAALNLALTTQTSNEFFEVSLVDGDLPFIVLGANMPDWLDKPIATSSTARDNEVESGFIADVYDVIYKKYCSKTVDSAFFSFLMNK